MNDYIRITITWLIAFAIGIGVDAVDILVGGSFGEPAPEYLVWALFGVLVFQKANRKETDKE